MTDILKKICEDRLVEIASEKTSLSLAEIRKRAEGIIRKPAIFVSAIEKKLKQNKPALIAEIKKKSPSRGIIRKNFNPVEIATAYERAGATCLSILTEQKYFAGNNEYLIEVRKQVKLPVLRKDFMLDEYQVYQAKILGADCILLIVAALEPSKMRELEQCAIANDLDVLVEVHDEAELEKALQLHTRLIGVNNRNLKTLEVTLETSRRLVKLMPEDKIKICESGISKSSEIKDMMQHGYGGFLVGESLVSKPDIEKATKELLDI
jgi:indole-3-glycerol phosphate synthase